MTANGSNQTLVTSGRSGSWSPDGTRLVLEKPVGLGLLLFQFPGTVTVLNGHEDTEPVFSPDGTKIAVRRGEPSDEIVVLDAAGQGGLVLSEGNGANRDPDWSPDGLRIAYGKAAAGTVVIVPAAGGPRQIFGSGADPAWSPDGTMLAFETPLGQIAKRRADGTGPTTNLTEGQDPEWQPAPPELRALEVNQSVQTWTNAIPLVTDKETGVRAFVQMTGGPQEITVKGKLAGVRDGAPLPGSPLTAINPGGKVKVKQNIVARGGTLADSLNFQLPLSWRHGTVKLRLESDVVCSEPAGPGADPATDCAVTVTFANQTRPSIVYIPIKYGAAVSPSFPQLREQMLRSRSILPTPAITYAYDSLAAFPSAVAPTEDAVNAALGTKWVYDTSGACIGPTCRSAAYVYYGVIVGDGGGLTTGIPGRAHPVPVRHRSAQQDRLPAEPRPARAGAPGRETSRGRRRARRDRRPQARVVRGGRRPGCASAHAVRAGRRRCHAGVGSAERRPRQGSVGFRPTLPLKRPEQSCRGRPAQDVRADGLLRRRRPGRWISKYTYEGLLSAFPAAAAPTGPLSTTATGDFVLVRGVVDPLADQATLQPAALASGEIDVPAAGSYRAQLLGGAETSWPVSTSNRS